MRPTREPIRQAGQTYFITFQTARRQYFFRNERWSLAFLNTLQRYQDSYTLHDFVIMPDHVHILLSPQVPLERAVQLIKGGFSFNARRAFQWKGDIWQAGFTDHRIRDAHDYRQHLDYLRQNVSSLHLEKYRFCGVNAGLPLAPCPQWLKPPISSAQNGGAEAPPLQSQNRAEASLLQTS